MDQVIEQNLAILKDFYQSFKDIIIEFYSQLCIAKFTSSFDLFDSLFLYTAILLIGIWICKHFKLPNKDYNQSYGNYFTANLFLMIYKYVPMFGKYVDHEKSKAVLEASNELNKSIVNKTTKLQEKGLSAEQLTQRLDQWIERDSQLYYNGKNSGALYVAQDGKFEEGVMEFAKNFIYANPMHMDLWPATRQMEVEVIRMTGELFGMERQAYGIITTGGSESILMAMLAYRNWAKETKGITQPNIVVPETAHAAFHKAGAYFNIEMRIADIDYKTYQVKMSDVRKKIDSNTICIVGSYPNFPFGIQDPVEDLAQLAKSHKIGLHVDACLGGFVIAFAKDNHVNIGNFDFNVDGVTSISCDQHKYGLAPKGVSTILFKTSNLRQFAFFGIATWSGGVYVTPSMTGSKSGAAVSGAWYAMQRMGRKQYAKYSKKIMDATTELSTKISEIPDLEVCGNPQICVVGFKSKNKKLNIYSVHSILSHKKWNVNTTQNPAGIHISITLANVKHLDQFVIDIKEAVAEVKANPEKYKKGGKMGAIYGTTQAIPSTTFANDSLKGFLDAVLQI